MENYIQELIALRIGGATFGTEDVIYKFEKIKRAKKEAIKKYPNTPIIDMGVGEPDAMADMRVIDELYSQAKKWENRGYTDNGTIEFQLAAVDYMKRIYDVSHLDAASEIIHSIGSKPALAMLPQAFINEGDITLMTVPGYPIIGTMTEWLGGRIFKLPLYEENHYLPDLKSIPEDVLDKAKLLYINYPNNPTGTSATKSFYEEVIEFARVNNILIIQDAAYAALTYDNEKPLSILTLDGAKDVCIEVHSLSKAFNMTGWRLAFLAGNSLAIKAFATVKDNNDSGQFNAIQLAGKHALEHQDITDKTSEKYSRRHDMLADVLKRLGFNSYKPKASFYMYVKIPKCNGKGIRFRSAEEFSQYLLREKLISTVPWDDVEPSIRLSVTFVADGLEKEKEVIEEIYNRLQDEEFIF